MKRLFWNLQQMTKVTRRFCWHQNFVPLGLSALAPGLYTCIKWWKKCIKSDFKEILFLNWQQMGKVIRPFCWHQNFVAWGLSAPSPGLYTCIKSWKKMYKIRLQRHLFETCNKWTKWQEVSVDIKTVPWGLFTPALGLCTCIKSWKQCIKSDFEENFLKLATNEKSDKTFLLISKLCPLGAVCPCPGLYTCIKSWKKIV